MSAHTMIEILASMFDLFKQMGSGIALDLQWLEISKRLQQAREEAIWSADLALVAMSLKAHAADYASTYQPHLGSERIRRSNAEKLDRVIGRYSVLRAHLEQQLPTP